MRLGLFSRMDGGGINLSLIHIYIAVPAAAVLTLVPYMVSVYQRGIYVQTTYMNAYSDIPMGLSLIHI